MGRKDILLYTMRVYAGEKKHQKYISIHYKLHLTIDRARILKIRLKIC